MIIESWLVNTLLAKKPRLVAITGAADLGKSYLAERVVGTLQQQGVTAACLGLDAYLMPRDERVARGLSGYDPAAHDLDTARDDIVRLLAGESIEYFAYRHDVGRRSEQATWVSPPDCLIIEGLHAVHPALAEWVDFSVFIETSEESLLRIRKEADLQKRKLTPEEAELRAQSEMASYYQYVYPYRLSCTVGLYLERRWHYRIV